jgi:excisionase family DNA binding protein
VTRDIPDTYTAREAAERLGIGLTSLYAGVRRGEVPAIQIGRRVLIPRSRLDDMLGRVNLDAQDGRS